MQTTEAFFAARGIDTGVEYSYVLHHRQTTDEQEPGRHNPHTHVVLPGTFYDEGLGERTPLYFSRNRSIDHIALLHDLTEQQMEVQMERYVGRDWERRVDDLERVREAEQGETWNRRPGHRPPARPGHLVLIRKRTGTASATFGYGTRLQSLSQKGEISMTQNDSVSKQGSSADAAGSRADRKTFLQALYTGAPDDLYLELRCLHPTTGAVRTFWNRIGDKRASPPVSRRRRPQRQGLRRPLRALSPAHPARTGRGGGAPAGALAGHRL
ncbi:MAG: hypothetical protein IPK19_37850 [Chloroflexi bacterium]|nr:hypothetical protein [Chloroflexota bacterium]